ncbi:MAG: YhdH/YhfP family quinone oxidoreductase [Aerococcus sp.]|nr:YhdH/YhfP family quinone oxidoreductase [Aerococcus sp.]
MDSFKAFVARKLGDSVEGRVETIPLTSLSAGNVLIKVAYSSVNYKDMLANQIDGHIVKNYPIVPGIDLSGVVVSSKDARYQPGDKVIATSYAIGVTHTGGYAEYARLDSDWLVPLPADLSLKDAMVFGTAGFTAALSVLELEKAGMSPDDRPRIVVSGASGGVGSVALAILKQAGYQTVTAMIRKPYQEDYVRALGANDVLYADTLTQNPPRPLEHRQFDFALDTVGGEVTNQLIPRLAYHGALSLCGRVGGVDLSMAVFPFISRGVRLIGVDSVNYPIESRKKVWQQIAEKWQIAPQLDAHSISLEALPETFAALKAGTHIGRTIVAIHPDLN